MAGRSKIGSNGPLVEIKEGNEEEVISSRRELRLSSGSMRSFLDMGGGQENPKRAPILRTKAQSRAQILAPREGRDSGVGCGGRGTEYYIHTSILTKLV